MALVSLTCAGLMINSLARILRTSPGFNPDHLLTAEVRLTGEKYIDGTDQEKWVESDSAAGWDFLPACVGASRKHTRRRKCGVDRLAAARG